MMKHLLRLYTQYLDSCEELYSQIKPLSNWWKPSKLFVWTAAEKHS